MLSIGFEGGQKSDTKNKNAVTSKSVGKKDGIFGSKNQKSKQQTNYEKKREIQLKKAKKSQSSAATKAKKVDKQARQLKMEKIQVHKEDQVDEGGVIRTNMNIENQQLNSSKLKDQSKQFKTVSNDVHISKGIEFQNNNNIITNQNKQLKKYATEEECKINDNTEEYLESQSSQDIKGIPQEQQFNLKIDGQPTNLNRIVNEENVQTQNQMTNKDQTLDKDEIRNLNRLKVVENDWGKSQATELTNFQDKITYDNQQLQQNQVSVEKDDNSLDYDLSANEDEQEIQRQIQLTNGQLAGQFDDQKIDLSVNFKQIEDFRERTNNQANKTEIKLNGQQSLAQNNKNEMNSNKKNKVGDLRVKTSEDAQVLNIGGLNLKQNGEYQKPQFNQIQDKELNKRSKFTEDSAQLNVKQTQQNAQTIERTNILPQNKQENVDVKINSQQEGSKITFTSKSNKFVQYELMKASQDQETFLGNRKKTIAYEGLKYKAYKSRMDKLSQQQTVSEINHIQQFMKNNKISCFKYNYSFQEIVQNFNSFQSYIQLSEDGEELIITNRKPREKLEYINEEDPDIIENVRNQYLNKKRRETNQPTVDNDYLPTELDQELDEIDFRDSKSSASCKLSDIQGFVYGGMSSRFWVHRKNINSMPPDKIDTVPFYSWNCITLQLKHRDVDLVIRSQTQMNMLLKLLIYQLQTWDGRRGTAIEIVRQLRRKELLDVIREQGREALTDQLKKEVTERCQYTVYRQVYFKYMILKFRHKISYTAFKNTMTIPELFYQQIIKTYDQALQEGIQTEDQDKRKMQDKIFIQITSGFMGQFRTLVLNTIAKNELWDQINSYEFYKIMRQIQENDSEMQKFDTSSNAWKSAEQQLKEKKVNELTCMTYFNKRNKEPIDTSSPIGRKNQLDQKDIDRKKQANQLFKVFQKNSCLDLFKDLKTDEKTEQYEQKSHAKFLHYKFKKKTMKIEFDRIRMFHALHLVDGRLYLMTMLRRIKLSKDMFILEIEQGREVFVQQDLSMDQLPYSFRYYDQLIQMIFLNIKTDRKEFYGLKKAIALTFYQNSFQNKMMCKLGFKENGKKEQLSFQPAVVNKKKRKEIDYFQNPHTRDIQRSRYIQIDNDIENEDKFKQVEENTNNRTAKLNKGGINISKATNTTHVKFCKPTVVNKERQDFIVFKGRFAVKQNNIKKNGEKLLAMQKVNTYVERNFEELWQAGKDEFLNFENTKTKMTCSQYLNKSRLQKNEIKARAQYEKMLVDQADDIIQKRVCQVKVKKQDYLKGVCDPKNEYELKAVNIDRFIENDYLFFGGSTNYNEKDLYDIKIQCKKVEMELRQRQRQRNRSKTIDGLELELNPLFMHQMNSFEYIEQRHLIEQHLKQMIDDQFFTQDQLNTLQVGEDGKLQSIKLKRFYRRICKIANELPEEKAKLIKESLLPQDYFEEQEQRSMSKSQYVGSRQSGFSSRPTLETRDSINRFNDESMLNTHNMTLNETKIFNEDSGSCQQDIGVIQDKKYFLQSKSEFTDRKLADMTVYQKQQAAVGKTNLYQISEYTQENE